MCGSNKILIIPLQPSNTDDNIVEYLKTVEVASYKIDLFHLFFV
tara:strand:+ start:8670 stop:8801 length:132 start_codon:yes stop_codon:yes gene_type:complete